VSPKVSPFSVIVAAPVVGWLRRLAVMTGESNETNRTLVPTTAEMVSWTAVDLPKPGGDVHCSHVFDCHDVVLQMVDATRAVGETLPWPKLRPKRVKKLATSMPVPGTFATVACDVTGASNVNKNKRSVPT
jgi:hypothetical protein